AVIRDKSVAALRLSEAKIKNHISYLRRKGKNTASQGKGAKKRQEVTDKISRKEKELKEEKETADIPEFDTASKLIDFYADRSQELSTDSEGSEYQQEKEEKSQEEEAEEEESIEVIHPSQIIQEVDKTVLNRAVTSNQSCESIKSKIDNQSAKDIA